jgi:hypothetical protein
MSGRGIQVLSCAKGYSKSIVPCHFIEAAQVLRDHGEESVPAHDDDAANITYGSVGRSPASLATHPLARSTMCEAYVHIMLNVSSRS